MYDHYFNLIKLNENSDYILGEVFFLVKSTV